MYVHGNQLTQTTDHRRRRTHFKSLLLPDDDKSVKNWGNQKKSLPEGAGQRDLSKNAIKKGHGLKTVV